MTVLSWFLALAAYLAFLSALSGALPAFHPPEAPSTYCAFLAALSKTPDTRLRFEDSFNRTCPDDYRVSETLERIA